VVWPSPQSNREDISELPEALLALPALRSLSLEDLVFNHPSLRFDLLFNRTLAVIGPRLQDLNIRLDMKHIPELVALGPWAPHLKSLSLTMIGRAQTHYNIDGVITVFISPARISLQQLTIHFEAPLAISHGCVVIFGAPRPPLVPQTLTIGTIFEALATIDFPNLRDLSVASPFNGPFTQREEEPLSRFINAHALRRLAVVPTPVKTHSSWGRTSYRFSAEYAHFLRFKVHNDHHLHELNLYVLEKREYEDGLTAVCDLLQDIRGPLTSLTLDGRLLEWNELEQLVQAVHEVSETLRVLKLKLNRFAPCVLRLLAETLPALEQLELETKEIGGLEQRSSESSAGQ
jgi:hypothetical protein